MAQSRANNLLSKREEERLIEAGRRVLLNGGYPNPDRVGCPGSEVLRALAERKMDLRDAEVPVVHVGMCSPCFVEYDALRHKAVWRRRMQVVGLCAIGLIAIAISAWLWRGTAGSHRRKEHNITHRTQPAPTPVYEQALLDLRSKSATRGEAPPSDQRPLVLQRNRLALTVYLPFGSEEGKYDLQISKKSGNPLLATEGFSQIQNGVTKLQVRLDLTTIASGAYSLEIRQHGHYWNSYPVLVK